MALFCAVSCQAVAGRGKAQDSEHDFQSAENMLAEDKTITTRGFAVWHSNDTFFDKELLDSGFLLNAVYSPRPLLQGLCQTHGWQKLWPPWTWTSFSCPKRRFVAQTMRGSVDIVSGFNMLQSVRIPSALILVLKWYLHKLWHMGHMGPNASSHSLAGTKGCEFSLMSFLT